MNVFLSNLGCKLNQAETESLARDLLRDGHTLVGSVEEAELHVINSCTVTRAAARDSRKTARRGARSPNAPRTVLTGCYASGSPEEARSLRGVDLVIPNDQKDRLLELIYSTFPALGAQRGRPVPVSYVPLDFGNARAAVKVEDGCNMACSFCIIPTTRGRQRSRSVDEVVSEVQGLAEAGVAEVVVTGVQISSYRAGGDRLYDLVVALLERTSVPRLRLTSIAPWALDRRLLDLWPDDRLCRHLHFSLQSGCSETLRRMRRPYTAEDFAELVTEARAAIPGVAITTDVIVGFPGESDAEFEESLAFVEDTGFARTHVFTYSEREGTLAFAMEGAVPHALRKERTHRMRAVAEQSERAFAESQLGSSAVVAWETVEDDRWRGTTDNYLRVLSPARATGRALDELESVRLDEWTPSGILASSEAA